MNPRTLMILAGVTVAVGVGAFIATRQAAPLTTVQTSGELFLPEIKPALATVLRIEIKDSTRQVSLVRADAKSPWQVAEKDNFPVGDDRITGLLTALASMTIVEEKTSKPELYKAIGVGEVSDPGSTSKLVTLKGASGKTIASFIIGNSGDAGAGDPFAARNTSGTFFVRNAGDAKSFLVKGDIAGETDPMAWVNKIALQLERNAIKSFTVTRHDDPLADPNDPAKTAVLEAFREKPTDVNFTVRNLPPGRELNFDGAADQPTNPLGYLSIDDVKPRASIDFTKTDPAGPTLPAAPDQPAAKFARTTAKYTTFDGMVITAQVTKHDGKSWIALDAAYDETQAPKADEKKPDEKKTDEKKGDEKAAAPAAKKPEDVKKDVDAFNAKHGKWAYAVPEYTATQIATRLGDLLKPPAKPASVGPEPLGPTGPADDNILVPQQPR